MRRVASRRGNGTPRGCARRLNQHGLVGQCSPVVFVLLGRRSSNVRLRGGQGMKCIRGRVSAMKKAPTVVGAGKVVKASLRGVRSFAQRNLRRDLNRAMLVPGPEAV